jgi:hypothetical protein
MRFGLFRIYRPTETSVACGLILLAPKPFLINGTSDGRLCAAGTWRLKIVFVCAEFSVRNIIICFQQDTNGKQGPILLASIRGTRRDVRHNLVFILCDRHPLCGTEVWPGAASRKS